jgi:hypothetical protein
VCGAYRPLKELKINYIYVFIDNVGFVVSDVGSYKFRTVFES